MSRLFRWASALARLASRGLRFGALCLALLVPHVTLALLVVRIAVGHGVATRPVAAVLSDRLECRATLDDTAVTFFDSTNAYGLRLTVEGEDQPFLTAGRVETDLNAARAALKKPIYRVVLYDANLRLRFDRNNKLLTRFKPKTKGDGQLPALRVRNGTLTLAKEGCEPFTVTGVSLTLEPGRPYRILGVVDDPQWGPIDVDGTLNPRTMATRLTLKNPGLALTPGKLAAIPFVPPAVWERLEVSGPSVPLDFTLWLGERVPRVRYRADFSGVSLNLREPGRPGFLAGPASGRLRGNDAGLRLDAAFDDARVGRVAVGVTGELARGDFEVKVTTGRAAVGRDFLLSLPYVPPVVWQQIDVAGGETSAEVRVRFNAKRKDPQYRVELDVARADLRVTSVDLDVARAAGKVVVEDGLVTLRGVTAKIAGGNAAGDADLDFRTRPITLRFDLSGDSVRLSELPAKFGLPTKMIDGRVRGKADLTVTLTDAGPMTTGDGTARIEEARLLGFPTKEPIDVTLRGDGSRIDVRPRSPALRKLMQEAGTDPPGLRAGRLACGACDAAAGGTRRVGKFASWACCLLGAKQAKPQDRTFVDAGLSLEGVDLDELIRRLDVPELAGLGLSGKLSLRVRVGVPINTPRAFDAYRVSGNVAVGRLAVAGRDLRRVTARVDFRDGELRLDGVRGEVGQGEFTGVVFARLLPAGDVSLSATVTRVPLAALAGKADLPGTVSGEVALTAALKDAGKVEAWRGKARLREGRLEAAGVVASSLAADVELAGGTLSLKSLGGDLGGARVTGSASLGLTGRMPVWAELSVPGADLSALAATLPPAWADARATGVVSLSGKLSGTLSPTASLSGGGKLTARAVGAYGLTVDALAADVSFRENFVEVPSIEARLYGGTARGAGLLALGDGESNLSLDLENIDAAALSRARKLPVPLGGRAGVRVTAMARRQEGTWTGKANASLDALVVRGVPVNDAQAELTWRGQRLDYRADADLLGGRIDVDGSYSMLPRRSMGRYDGRVRVERVGLRNLLAAFGRDDVARQIDGVLSLDVPYNHSDGRVIPRGQGRVVLRDLRLGERELADTLAGELRLGEDGVSLRDVSSSFAGGLLRLGGSYRFSGYGGGFTLSLTGADAGRLTAFLPQGGELLSGSIDVSLRGSFGPEWLGGGTLSMARGKLLGVEVSGWRLPVEFRAAPEQGRFELTVRDSHAQVGNGRALLDGTVRFARTASVSGSVRFFDAGLPSLAGAIGDVSAYANGRVTGRVDFSGADMTSLEDLDATLSAKLTDSQALQLPVLSLLVPYLVPGQGATTFSTGEFSARLSRGVLRVRELSLEGPLLVMVMHGTVTLRQARLDLDVVARTNPLGLDPLVIRVLSARVPATGPVPVTVALRIADLLAERTVYLRVTGTAKTPVIQVEPLRTLSDEAVRFFVGRALGPVPLP